MDNITYYNKDLIIIKKNKEKNKATMQYDM